jgi:MFS family permease
LGTCLMSVCFVLAFVVPAGPLLMATALLAGIADGFTEIVYTSRLQAEPDDLRARLFGLSATAETCGFAVGMVTSSALLDGLWRTLVVVGAFHAIPTAGAIGLLVFLSVRRRAGEKPLGR